MRRTLIALALAVAVFTGCGGDDDEPESAATPAATQEEPAGGGGGEELALASPEDGSLEYDKTELTAPAGSVTITYSNPSQVPHAVALEGNGVEETGETVTASDAPPLTVELEAGTYTFYCPVGQHRSAGMEGTLTVE
jgi:plastocyanin